MEIYSVRILDIDEDKIDKLSSLIDLEKKCRIKKFINKKDKVRTLIGEILIRTMIVEELGIENENIMFEKNKYGKPYLKGQEKYNFNISHSGSFVVCAIDDKPIGIDIEKVKYIEYKEIAETFFTLNEFNYINNNDLYIKLCKFYEIWTLKESYVKCCGQGLSIPLKSFSIDINEYESIKVITDKKYKKYIFNKFDIGLDYKVAVCSLNKNIPDNITIIDQNKLTNNFLERFYYGIKYINDSV
jgi:4'-phosphopantetheinyl transferase